MMFDEAEATAIATFLELMERQRLAGQLIGWRLTRDDGGCKLEVMMFPQRSQIRCVAPTFSDALMGLSDAMISAAMQGAGSA